MWSLSCRSEWEDSYGKISYIKSKKPTCLGIIRNSVIKKSLGKHVLSFSDKSLLQPGFIRLLYCLYSRNLWSWCIAIPVTGLALPYGQTSFRLYFHSCKSVPTATGLSTYTCAVLFNSSPGTQLYHTLPITPYPFLFHNHFLKAFRINHST